MKKYIEHMQTKSPHDRRQHAAQVATVVTSLVFVGWVTTLGVRLADHQAAIAKSGSPTQLSQLANVINGLSPDTPGNNTLEVATTTDYTGVPASGNQTLLPQQ